MVYDVAIILMTTDHIELPLHITHNYEFVFAPSYRDLSRGCCVSIICLLIQFSFKSATETTSIITHAEGSHVSIAIIFVCDSVCDSVILTVCLSAR